MIIWLAEPDSSHLIIWNDSEPWISDYFLVSLIFDSSLIDYSCLTLPACLSTKIVHVIYCQELMIGIFVFGYFNNCKFNFSVITHCYLVDDIQCAKSFWWFKCEKFPSASIQTQLSYDSTLQLWSSQSAHEISVFAYQWPDFWQFQHLSFGEGPLLPLPSSKIYSLATLILTSVFDDESFAIEVLSVHSVNGISGIMIVFEFLY